MQSHAAGNDERLILIRQFIIIIMIIVLIVINIVIMSIIIIIIVIKIVIIRACAVEIGRLQVYCQRGTMARVRSGSLLPWLPGKGFPSIVVRAFLL